jgi:VWFA-related protein
MVTVEVTVLDGKNQPVPDLTRDSFAIFENGVRQEVAAFEAIDLREAAASTEAAAAEPGREGESAAARPASPWTYVLLIDDIHLTPSQASDVRKAASAFLAGVPAGARMMLIATGARVVEDHSMPDGRAVLEARLRPCGDRSPSPRARS